MTLLILGLALFIGIHLSAVVAPNPRSALIAKMGLGPWKGIYSLVAIVGLVLMVMGYQQAKLAEAWSYLSPPWLQPIISLLMLASMILLVATYSKGWLHSTVKHPLLNAVKFWALAHLLASGGLAGLIIFSSLLAWAVVVRIHLKRRQPQLEPAKKPFGRPDWIAIGLGLGLYGFMVFYGHSVLLGIPLH